jgi:predicted nucleic acid-binding protein
MRQHPLEEGSAHEAKRVEQFEAHLVRRRRCLLGKSNREYPSHSWPHEPKVQRRELSKQVALAAARLLQAADIELLPSRSLLGTATGLAIELEHPAYDCLYLALAMDQDCPFVTADQHLLRKLEFTQDARLRGHVVGLEKAAAHED